MSTLRLLGNALVIAPIKVSETSGGILLPGKHYTRETQQWTVLQVGPGGRSKKGALKPLEIVPGDTIITPALFEPLHEFSDGVRIVDGSVALAVVGKV